MNKNRLKIISAAFICFCTVQLAAASAADAQATPSPVEERQLVISLEPRPTQTPLYTPTPSPVPQFTVGGKTVSAAEESVTLSSAEELLLLEKFPNLKAVDASSFVLDSSTAYSYVKKYPDVAFKFSLDFFGTVLGPEDTAADISGRKDISLNTVQETAACMQSLLKINMCGCGFTNEEMGALQEKYPSVKFVWEVKMGTHTLRTDAVGFSCLNPGKYVNENSSESYKKAVKNCKRLYTKDIEVLKYCTDLEALDLGHNYIDDLSVLSCLPKLKILIVADNKLTDISVLKDLKELVYVEFFMNAVTDISCLANHEKLLDLNFCNNKVADLSPLETMPQLERVWCAGNKFDKATGKALQEKLPDCIVDYTARDDTADGWREHERYEWMRAYVKGEHNPE